MDVDSQPMPPSEDEFRGASSEAHITQTDTVGVVDTHAIPGNLSPAQLSLLASYQILGSM